MFFFANYFYQSELNRKLDYKRTFSIDTFKIEFFKNKFLNLFFYLNEASKNEIKLIN